MNERDQARLAVDLGYTQYREYTDTGTEGSVAVTDCILPIHPFMVTGRHLIVREIVQDRLGRAKIARDGESFRYRVKMLTG